MTTTPNRYHQAIIKYLNGLGSRGKHKNPDLNDEVGKFLGNIYQCEAAIQHFTKLSKHRWDMLVANDLLAVDDVLRKHVGEREHQFSTHFSLLVKTGEPRVLMDTDKFIRELVSHYNLEPEALTRIAEGSKKLSKAPVSKRVVERTVNAMPTVEES